ncbi:MAG TPA: putative Ig domain-containing protein [Rhodocyclaceae bacterium]|nr:putative Ig domain-containing protein [Rhodocyclaceae bacterium]
MGHADLGARLRRFFSRGKRGNASARAVDKLAAPRRAICEEIEARILFSADLAPGIGDGSAEVRVIHNDADSLDVTPAATPAVTTHEQQGDTRVNPYSYPYTDPYADSKDVASTAAGEVVAQRTHEIVFVDSAVEDQHELIRGVLQNNPDAEIVRLDGSVDGIAQITNALVGKQDISAIHLITHGSAGTLQIGVAWLNEQTMALYADSIASWRNALTDDADILLYGCDLASTAAGRALANDIATLSGADVAASDDLTGNRAIGGDWDLEYRTGIIESSLAVSANVQAEWAGTLAVTVGNSSSAKTDTAGSPSLSWSHTVAAGDDGILIVTVASRDNAPSDGVTYNGQAMSLLRSVVSGGAVTAEVWYLLNPSVGTANIVVSHSGSNHEFVAGATNFYGVRQTSTFGTVATETASDSNMAVSSSAGDMVIDVFATRQQSSIPAVGAGQTTLWSQSVASGSADPTGASSYEIASGSSTAMTWSRVNASAEYAAIGVALKAAPVAPVISVSNGALGYTENAAATVIDNKLTVTDADSTNLSGATIQITDKYQNGQDVLAFTNQNGITGSWDAATGTLTLSGTTTVANYQTALSSVTYRNSSENPNTSARIVTFTVNDGSKTGSNTRSINVTAVNDAPVIANLAGDSLAYAEGDGAVVIEQGANASISDVDSTDFNGGTLTVSFPVGSDSAEDVLAIRNQGTGAGQIGVSGSNVTYGGITIGSFTGGSNGASLVITFNASSTPLAAQALIRNITFQDTDTNTPTTGSRTVRFVLTDGDGGSSGNHDTTVTVSAVNDAPVNTVPAAQATNEDTALVFSSAKGNQIQIADVDAGNSNVQVTLSVTNGTLTLAGTTGLTFTTGSGTASANMVFTGSVSNINAALATLTFNPTANFNGSAMLSLTTNDLGNTGGGALQDADTVTITVNAVNDAPVNTVPAAQATNEDTALVFSSAKGNQIQIADIDAGSSNVQVTLSVTNGTLTLAGTTGLTFTTGSGTASANMVFTGSVANINAALATLTFNPTTNFNGSAMLSLTTNDLGNTGGSALQDADTVAITVHAVNDAPVNTVPAAQATNEDTALIFSGGNQISISDVDAGNGAVSVTLSVLHGALTLSGISGLSFTTGDGTADASMMFTGTLANIQAALAGLKYLPSTDYVGADTLTIVTNDLGNTGIGGGLSATSTVAITVNAVNDPPVITSTGPALAYTENCAATPIDPDLTISDIDSATLVSAMFQISNYQNGQDVLAFTDQNGITGYWNAAAGTLTLTGSSGLVSLAYYQTALRSVTYQNTSDNPVTTPRTVSFWVNDGGLNSNTVTRNINLTAVNDAPVVSTTGTTLSYTENAAATAIDTGLTISDADNANLVGATVQITGASDQDVLAFTNQNGISGTWNAGTGTLTLSGSATVANYQAALRSITYFNTSDNPSTATRTVSFSVNDGSANSSVATRTISVTAVDDAPVAVDDGVFTSSNTPVVVNMLANDSDVEGNALSVTEINGSAITAGGAAINVGNAMVSLAADGQSFTVTPDAAFSGTFSFTYTISDGSGGSASATVNVTVGDNSAPTGTDITRTINEDTPYTVQAADFGYDDSDGHAFTAVRIDSLYGQGSLRLNGVAVSAGQVVSATDISKLVFTPGANANGINNGGFTFSVQDIVGSFDSSPKTFSFDITAVNDAPVNSLPGPQSVAEDSTLRFSGSNAITVSDVANEASLLKVTLSVTNGALSLNGIAGLSFISGNGTGDASMVFTGTQAAINAALNGLVFAPTANFNGTAILSIITDDQDIGGALQDSDNLTITVSTVNDAPVATITPTTYDATEQTTLTLAGTGLSITDVDAGAASMTATLSVVSGILNVTAGSSGAGVAGSGTNTITLTGTLTQINNLLAGAGGATLNYIINSNTPPATDTLSLLVNDNGNAGSGSARTASDSATINITAVNDAPVATIAQPSYSATEQVTLRLDGTGLSISDVDAASGTMTVTLSVVSGELNVALGSSGASVNHVSSTTVRFTGTLAQINQSLSGSDGTAIRYTIDSDAPPATDTLTLAVTDNGALSDSKNVTINITAVNDAPTLQNALSDQAATEGTPFSFTFLANTFADADTGDTLSYTTSSLPAWLSFNAATRTFSGTPTNADVGDVDITVTATDGSGAAVSDVFRITVANVNDAPTLDNALTDQAATEDTPFSFTFLANTFGDVDAGDTLSYATSSLPTWLSFDAATRTFSGTPTNADVGYVDITVTATDGSGAAVSDVFRITVANVNDAPTLDNALADQDATEDTPFSFTVPANTFGDMDAGDTLSYAASSLPTWLSFDAATRTFSGTPTNADVGYVDITVTATDGAGAPVSNAFRITVVNVNEAPTVANLIPDRTATEDALFSFTVPANTFGDVDAGDTLSYTTSSLPTWLSFDAATRTFSGTPSDADVGYIDITVTATDGSGLSASDVFRITVANSNDAPLFTSTPTTDATETTAYTYSIVTSDADPGDVISISATTLPAWLTLIDHGDGTATLTGTPGNAEVGTHSVVLQVSDGTSVTVQNFTITVANVNDAPTLGNAIPDQAATEGSAFSYTLPANTFTDVDAGDTLSYTTSTLPAWLSFDAATRTFSGTPANGDAGVFNVTVTATDGAGAAVSDVFQITITHINGAPVITSDGGGATASVSIAENTTFVTTVMASDDEANSTLTYSISGGADADKFSIDPTTGALTFNAAPAFDAPGDADGNNVYDVIVQVTDGTLSDTQAIAITVTDSNAFKVGPVSDNDAGSNTVAENSANGSLVGITARAADADATNNMVTYSLSNDAGGRFAIDASTGVVSVANGALLDYETAQSHGITVVATSADGSSSSADFTITVGNLNESPSLTDAAYVIGRIGTPLSLSGISVSDPENDPLTLTLTVANGTLNVATVGTVTASGNGSAKLSLHGRAADINATVNSLSYQSRADFVGDDSLAISTTDGVFSVTGSTRLSIRSAVIIAPLPDPEPSPTLPEPALPEPAPTPAPSPAPAPTPAPTQSPVSRDTQNVLAPTASMQEPEAFDFAPTLVTPTPTPEPQRHSNSDVSATAQTGNFVDFNLEGIELHTTNAAGMNLYSWQRLGSTHAEDAQEDMSIQIIPATPPETNQGSLFDLSPSQAGKMAATAVSAGVVFWASRSVGLLAALMASVPAWRTVDPLPILARDRRRNGETDDLIPDESEADNLPGARTPPAKPVFAKSTLLTEVDS